MAALPLGLEEKAYLFSSWIAPVCYLRARADRPTEHVLSQLNLVHKIALGLNNWHLTMPILQLPIREVGLAQASLAAYAEWVHSQSFVRFVQRPAQFAERHVAPFRRWAFSFGLLIEEEFLPFLQVALVPLPGSSFLQGSLKSYSIVRREGGEIPPPPIQRLQHMPIWHNALLRNARSFSYWSPPLIRRGVMRWGDLVDNGAIPLLLWDMLAPTFGEGRTDSFFVSGIARLQGAGARGLGSNAVLVAHAVVHAASSATPSATDAGGVARFSAAFSAEVGQGFY